MYPFTWPLIKYEIEYIGFVSNKGLQALQIHHNQALWNSHNTAGNIATED